ncbi:MAG: hypothetical protein AB7N65_22720 [Vicinamibacterales bacterium]
MRRAPIAAILAAPAALHAQYFGQNKVRYEDLDFSVLKTRHFDVYYYEQEQRSIDQAARLAERWYTRLSTLLNHELSGRQPLIMYRASSRRASSPAASDRRPEASRSSCSDGWSCRSPEAWRKRATCSVTNSSTPSSTTWRRGTVPMASAHPAR